MPGKIFFTQMRAGKDRRPFRLIKFRTMKSSSSIVEGVFNPGDTSRVTDLGAFLRKYKIDEIPQLFNVLKGDMSLVGPRPETDEWISAFPEKWNIILNVRPGITDNASIEFRNEEELLASSENPEEMYRNVILPRKMDHYISYVEDHTFTGDIRIILKTIKKIFL